MGRNLTQIEQKLQNLEKEKNKLKNEARVKRQAERNKKRKQERQKRNRRAYECGGLVEKMGLFNLPNEDLICLLWLANKSYKNYDSEKLEALKDKAKDYFEEGKKLEQLEPIEKSEPENNEK